MINRYSYYDILGIPSKASDNDVKRAYLDLAKKYHPDRHPNNRKIASHRFQAIVEAYEAIKTREKRAMYNRKLRIAAENDNRKPAGNSSFSKLGTLFTPAKQPKETQR